MGLDGLSGAIDVAIRRVNGLRDYCGNERLRLALETVLRVGVVEAGLNGCEPYSEKEKETLCLVGMALISDLYACERGRRPESARVWAYASMDDDFLRSYVRERRDNNLSRLLRELEVEDYAE